MGISVLCGKTIGSGNKDETNRVFSQCLCFALLVGITITAIVLLGAQPIAMLLGSSGDYLPETAAYLRGAAPCSIAIILVVGLLPIMQIDGDRSRAAKAVVAATIVNGGLSLANGLALHWGLFGMAVALTLGYFVGAFVILLHFRGGKGMFRIKLAGMSRSVVGEMLSYGLPNGLQQICRSLLGICMNHIIKSVADPSMVGVLTAINTAALLCMAFGTGVGQSTSVIVSVLAGEKDVESMKHLLRNALRTAITIDAVLSVIMFVVAPFLMRVFLRKNPDLLDTATFGFRLYCASIVVYAVNVTIRSYYQAMHLTRLSADSANETLAKISDGDLNQEVQLCSSRELASLATYINGAVASLKEYAAESERRIEQDLSTARDIQKSALPRMFPPFPGVDAFDIYASMTAAKYVGGDFYDLFKVDDHKLGFLIADVSGKGIPAALFMMRAKTHISTTMRSGVDLVQAVTQTNAFLCEDNDTFIFVTMWAAILDWDTGELTYVNAGHDIPLLRHDGQWRWLEDVGGPLLGAMDFSTYDCATVKLDHGDELYLYTDGVTEAMNPTDQLFSKGRMVAFLQEHANMRPRELDDAMREEVAAWTDGAEQSDDITMLTLEYKHAPRSE